MKAIKIAGIIMMILLIGLPFAFADDANTDKEDQNAVVITPADENEVQIMKTPYGAEVRLLQLERKITLNVLRGEEVIRVIEKNHSDANTKKAKEYLGELEALLPEIKQLLGEDINANEAASKFVSYKAEANSLIRSFRTETRQYLDSNDRREIQDAIKNLDKNELKALNEEIKNTIRNHNAERAQKAFQIMGTENEEIVEQIRDGNVTMKEIKDSFKEAYQGMTPEQKQEVGAKIKQETAKKIIASKEIIQQIRTEAREQIQTIREQVRNQIRETRGGNTE